MSLYHGEHTFSGTAYGYSDLEEQPVILESDSLFTFEMNLNYYTATFNAVNKYNNSVANASLTFRDTVYDLGASGNKTFIICVGDYDFNMSANTYDQISSHVTMEAKDTVYNIALELHNYNVVFPELRLMNANRLFHSIKIIHQVHMCCLLRNKGSTASH